jgi:hypothetical protein
MPLYVDKISTTSLSLNGVETTGGASVSTICVDMSNTGTPVSLPLDGIGTIDNVFFGSNPNQTVGTILKLSDGSFSITPGAAVPA